MGSFTRKNSRARKFGIKPVRAFEAYSQAWQNKNTAVASTRPLMVFTSEEYLSQSGLTPRGYRDLARGQKAA